jgi:hypothetical protein
MTENLTPVPAYPFYASACRFRNIHRVFPVRAF